jgi:metallophosphoesterase superfamily enzyme
MPDAEKLWLARMQAGREWVWIAGNHDAGPVELGGEYVDEVTAGSLTFRHIAESGAQAEVSGHYHPKHSLSGPARACFVYDENRLIMPAFGTYTGGIPAVKSPIRDLFAERAFAVLTGPRALVVPLP